MRPVDDDPFVEGRDLGACRFESARVMKDGCEVHRGEKKERNDQVAAGP